MICNCKFQITTHNKRGVGTCLGANSCAYKGEYKYKARNSNNVNLNLQSDRER